MFKQLIKDGYQAEVPDIWLEQGNPWEVKRHDIRFEVGFSGKTVTDKGKTTWIPEEKVHTQYTATARTQLGHSYSYSCQGSRKISAMFAREWVGAVYVDGGESSCSS